MADCSHEFIRGSSQTYQYNAAKSARENGVPIYVLISAIEANSKSKIFYTSMKGALDDAVHRLGFPSCFILQPASLIRKNTDRVGETVGIWALKAFNAVGLHRVGADFFTEWCPILNSVFTSFTPH